jgi:Zn-dependent protease
MDEITEILIAMACMVIAVTIAWRALFPDLISGILISLFTVGIGFVGHEMGHKWAAERFGIPSRFILWPMGILLMFLTAAIGFIFAAVGAVYIFARRLPKNVNGIISLAGPAVNLIFASIFFFVLVGSEIFGFSLAHIVKAICVIGMKLNGFLAFFNLIPILPLDGAKVLSWNSGAWIATLVIAFIFAWLI